MVDAPYTAEHARKILTVVDAGLVSGLGKPVPGQMCVEAALCYALGLPHGDDPQCVATSVRAFKIGLNDRAWSSPQARAKGMRALAVAQLGSKGVVSDAAFVAKLAEGIIREIVPIAIRAAATRNPAFAERLEAAALRCAAEGTRDSSLAARDLLRGVRADAPRAADADAAAYAAADAAAAAYAAYADAAARAAAAAAAAAADADAAAYAARDALLTKAAEIALSVLRELGAPGVALWDEVNT